MKFRCAFNAAIKNDKIASKKKQTFFPKYFQQNWHLKKKKILKT